MEIMIKISVIAALIAWPCSGQMVAENRTRIVASHNEIRSKVKPTAADMWQMNYNESLEEEAQNLVNCYDAAENHLNRSVNIATETEVVWAAARNVGCANKTCESPNGNYIAMLCIYDEG
ncbi:unnamed protein product [Rodentolepis nana]|uniref:SCP domain-containing protein n=1 Tax=Rodentolepis nana TaxID=102285 RepID=A0A0R3TYB8_RODNA|nr:unnamed protein product [Rodentolepis nana]